MFWVVLILNHAILFGMPFLHKFNPGINSLNYTITCQHPQPACVALLLLLQHLWANLHHLISLKFVHQHNLLNLCNILGTKPRP